MTLKIPESMNECLYFTNRSNDNGKIMAWVLRKDCPKCKKAKMGKPIKKNGKVDKKADYYECPACKYQESEDQIGKGLHLSIIYTCPKCNNQGETTTEYQRKPYQGVKAYVFNCQKCNEKLGITQKLKEPKKKKSKEEEESKGVDDS